MQAPPLCVNGCKNFYETLLNSFFIDFVLMHQTKSIERELL